MGEIEDTWALPPVLTGLWQAAGHPVMPTEARGRRAATRIHREQTKAEGQMSLKAGARNTP